MEVQNCETINERTKRESALELGMISLQCVLIEFRAKNYSSNSAYEP